MINMYAGLATMVLVAVFWVQRDYTTQHGGTFADPVLMFLFVCGGVLLVRGLLRRDAEQTPDEPVKPGGLAVAVVLLVAWVGLLAPLGYLVSGTLFFVLTALVFRHRPFAPREIGTDVVVGAALVGLVYLLFTRVLLVPLPEGFLG